MSNQLQITGGAKVRSLEGVITGTSGVLSSVPLGGANGVATLDSGGKVPVSQLPSSVVTYLGTWNAATNTPTLTNGTGDAGDMYICNVAGTVNFGAGPITFAVGDWVLYGSGTWQKSNGQNGTVTSVAVTESGNALTITGSPITTAGTINIGFAGSSTQYIAGDGTLVTFPTIITEAQTLITDVYNETGATLTKGTVVYINGGHGNLPTVTKALATSDATSAQTYGVVQADITNNNNGHVVVIGSLGDLDTQAYAAGTQLYLSSTTAGAWTSTKQYAPAHLVYVGIVVRSHPTQGVVEIKIQNGFELDELHNVSAQSPSNGNILQYNSSTSLWTAVAGTTTNIAEGTNLYYTDARSRAAFSETVTGLDYNSTTGVLSTTAGYGIPTTANQTNWTTAYNDSIVSAAVTGTTTKTLTLTQQDGGTVTASWSDYDTAPVTSVFGRTGAVTAQSGDYTTTLVTEGTNLYFTNARSIASTLTGYVSGAGTITSADSILSAIQKLNGNIGTLVTGVSSVFGRTGAVVAASGDYTTTQVTEGTNLYYTDARARGALSFTAGSGAYNSTTGVITIPTNTNQLTNGASFITLTSLSAGTGIIYNNTTGVISSTITQYTDAMARAAISLTTTGTSGAATYNSTTGVLNIPNYSETTFGTVTSVGLSSTTSGVTIGSSPITTSGTITLAIATASGTQQGLLSSTDWTTFNNKQNALTNPVTGTGTTNYLPKFTGTSTIGNSLIYDDGSKVYIGTTTTNAISTSGLTVNGSSTSYVLYNGGVVGFLYGSSIAAGIALSSTYDLRFETGNAGGTSWDERGRIYKTTGNLSIGYGSSPADAGYKLDVNGTGRFSDNLTVTKGSPALDVTSSTGTGYALLTANNTGGFLRVGRDNSAGALYGNAYAGLLISSGAYPLLLGTNDTVRLTIASTGAATFSSSVGAGISPSSWGSIFKAVQVGNIGAFIAGRTDGYAQIHLGTNAYYDGTNWLYLSTNYASRYYQADGVHYFQSASSGTGGTAISWASQMTITSSGNVGIGTTGPSKLLEVSQDNSSTTTTSGIKVTNWSGTNDTRAGIVFQNYDNNGAAIWSPRTGSTAGVLIFGTNGSGGIAETGITERMRITSGGNVLIGTTTDAGYKLRVNGTSYFDSDLTMAGGVGIRFGGDTRYGVAKVYNASVGDMFGMEQVGTTQTGTSAAATRIFTAASGTNYISLGWYTNATNFVDGLRLNYGTSNVTIGTSTDNGTRLNVYSNTNTGIYLTQATNQADAVVVNVTATSYNKAAFVASLADSASGIGFFYYGQANGVKTYAVYPNGNVQNTNGSYGTLSDYRIKENIVDATPKLENLLKVRVVNYNLIAPYNQEKQIGVVAQELEKIFPSMVYSDTDGVKGVKYSIFIPMLIKAIQEQQAQIEELKQLINNK